MHLENKNILIILDYGALGGAQRQALGLAKYLVEEKKCVVDLMLVHSDFESTEFTEFKKKSKIRNTFHIHNAYFYLPYEFSIKNLKRIKWILSYLYQLRKTLINKNYALTIPYLNKTSKVAFLIYKLLPSVKTTFWHQLGLDFLTNDLIEKYIAKNIPFVIGNAPNCFDIFKNEYPIATSKLHLLPQYLTLDVINKDKTKVKKELEIPTNTIVVGMIAHYRKDKYFDLLLDAFFEVLKVSKENIYLVILGNKDNDDTSLEIYKNLKNKVLENNVANNVSILSNIEVSDILNILDIAVLVSQIEGMPNSVMEYMAYGIPSIVSNHPGCKQLLEDSEYLIENNQKILEEKLLKLIKNKEERIKEGNLNLARIKKFNLPSYVENFDDILSQYI
ncbi:glycosyltransferase family 4 protein [Polaribacter batillariae]|uniref:Glycosyltransferase family 4 protein n=1 Tax=Polaribacter batillariae TaxID=2808900 RepID=A0ABX7SXI1_9FLAO|nr:glycosyltransferase family 4 protein [Polaribacter batillariae]QTD37558.1 glycosyltransferase family 4 protein [Polaribacter batillariae]